MTDEQDAAITAQQARDKRAFNESLWLNTFNTILADRLDLGLLVSEAVDYATLWANKVVNSPRSRT